MSLVARMILPYGLLAAVLVATVRGDGQPANSPSRGNPLPGTQPLTIDRPLDEMMVEGIDRCAMRELAESVERREIHWQRDYGSRSAYERSIRENRERFRQIVGAVDSRVENPRIELLASLQRSSQRAEAENYVVHAVRWDVLDGVTAEGLLLKPRQSARACVVALPDADWTPEMFAGLADGVSASAQLPRRLAEQGCLVLVPTLISREDTFSGHPDVVYTNQPHREFIYRMAFQMGRHVIGYEVQKVLAAVEALKHPAGPAPTDAVTGRPIGVVGVGEGGLLALYSAAIDPRLEAALVCGYFQRREALWREPIYRNVWSLLTEFGDAEIASLVAPRRLVIEACAAPEVTGPPAARNGRRGGAAPGRIENVPLASVQSEFDRARVHFDRLGIGENLGLFVSGDGEGPAGSSGAVSAFLEALEIDVRRTSSAKPPERTGPPTDALKRQQRQFDELVAFTQGLFRRSARVRDKFWSKADRSSVEAWIESTEFYRNYVWEELFGKLPEPTIPPNPRTRQVLDEPAYRGYEVVLDVYPDVIASGILLLPKDQQPGERRPVVVCQHGLEGTPVDTITGDGRAHRIYKSFTAELARRGYITYAPQNPYRGEDRFRVLQRKSNPMKRSLFSYIIRQHERTLEWLASLPGVDADRIGFYGLSYGGKTAVRVPPVLKQYSLSICSADFNEWIRKNVTNTARYSYMFTREYEMYEWNMGHVANYAELAGLMAPRPLMVERGHDDSVAPDEWVAWEYAKVRRLYVKLGIGDRTEIEFFDGPHAINAAGTFEFLDRHLK